MISLSISMIILFLKEKTIMGKGDKKSRRGKIWKGTYGVNRPRPSNKKTAEQPAKKSSKKK
ncbi:30S ribosomal protein THX [Ekhidna sp.]|uniref:30S ribosomal protein THX n=1 Tax=Ekhidna sp. TaxID=2608089 RepID=UPI003B5CB8DC